jgi:hypothetical protein
MGTAQDNQWLDYLETGRDVPRAVKPKQIIDVEKQLKAKYPGVPMPTPGRIIRPVISPKQERAINYQRGEKQ